MRWTRGLLSRKLGHPVDHAHLRPGADGAYDAHRRRSQIETLEIVQRHAQVMREGRLENVAVGHQDDHGVRVLRLKSSEAPDNPLLDLHEGLALGRRGDTPPLHPRRPQRIAGKLIERAAGPTAEVDLVERGLDLRRELQTTRQRFRGFKRSHLRTYKESMQRHARQSFSKLLRFAPAGTIEAHGRRAAGKRLPHEIVRRMPDE
jgi:hypothetical protein